MNQNELLDYYEARVKADKAKLDATSATLRSRVDFDQGMFHNRVILSDVRGKSGIPVCSGAADCISQPTAPCTSGLHKVCQEHTTSCYLCPK